MQFSKVLRNIVLVGIFAIPFIPFIVSTELFFPFITGKNFAFRIIIEIIFASWLLLAIRDVSYRPSFSWILTTAAAFVGIIALADIFGAYPEKSIWSNFERMEGLVTLVHLLMYLVVAGTVLQTGKMWTRFLNTSIVASVVMAFYGFSQLAGVFVINQGGVRLDGRLGNATYLAIYMVFHIFITAMLLLRWRGGNALRYFYGIAIFFQLTILYFTATRGAILGLFGGAIVSAALIALFGREYPKLRKTGTVTLVGLLLVVVLFIGLKDTPLVQKSGALSRISSISLEEGSTRFTIWGMAYQGFKEHPILGWGQGNFNIVFNKYYDPSLYAQEQWFDRVHNIVFDWLIAGGILGFLAYLSMYLALLYCLWFKRTANFSVIDRSLITGLMAAYVFHNIFVFDNLISYILFFTFLAYVYDATRTPSPEGSFMLKEIDRGTVERLLTPLVIIVLVFSLYAVNAKGILAGVNLINSLGQHEAGLQTNLAFSKKALAYDSFGQQEVREQLISMSNRLAPLDVDLGLKQEYFDLATTEMEKQIMEAPNDARTEFFVAALYANYNNRSIAEIHFERARELSPNKQSILLEVGRNKLNSSKYEEAIKIFKEASELDDGYKHGYVMYAISALLSGNVKLADEILLERFGTVLYSTGDTDDRLLGVYLQIGLRDRVLDIVKARAQSKPNDLNAQLQVVAAYVEMNNISQGILEVERLIIQFEEFKEQGEEIIRELRAGKRP